MFEELCNCGECPLRESKAKLGCVPGVLVGEEDSNEPLPLMLVGISPAKEELRQKVPMTGPSGQIGRQTAKKVGLDTYYITNAFSCYYPPEATESQIRKAASCCRPRLRAEIDYFLPKVIMPLGNVPTQEFLGYDVGVTSVMGRVFRINENLKPMMVERLIEESGNSMYWPAGPIGDLSDISPNSVIVPSIQPAAVLHEADKYPDLKHNFDISKLFLENKYRSASDPETVIVTEENIVSVLDYLSQAPQIVIDLETTTDGFYPYGQVPDKIRCIAIAADEKVGYIVPAYLMHHPGIHHLINTKPGIYHNGHFDCGFLMQEGFSPIIAYDTMLAHFLIDEREYAHGLKVLAAKYLGAPDWEENLKVYLPNKKASYDNIPDDVLYPYAARDVCYTYQLKKIFEESISEYGNGTFAKLLMPCTNMFNDIRHQGIRVDVREIMKLDDYFEKEYDRLEGEIWKTVGWPLTPSSPADVKKYMYEDLKLEPSRQYGYTTSKKWMNHFLDIDGIRMIIEAREFQKLKSTYLRGLTRFVGPDLRVHPYTKLYGTVTGRISTSDPSVMNITKKGGIKNIYVPSESDGYILDVDFSGMELRCYAVLSDDKYLQQLLWDDADPHSIVAGEASQRAGRLIERGPAKAAVFGKMYGRGLESFKTGLRLEEDAAIQLIHTIESFFPSLNEYHKKVRKEVHSRGELVSYFGRRRRFPLITKENVGEIYRQGGNFGIQSMYSLIEQTGATPLFPVHDSVVFDLKGGGLENVHFIKEEMQRFAEDLTGNIVPFKVEAKVGKTWGKMDIEV